MAYPKGMPKLVCRLLGRPLEQNFIAGWSAIKLGIEAADRDEGNPARILRLAEDEVKRGYIEVNVGDREHPILTGYPVHDPLEDDV